MDRQVEK